MNISFYDLDIGREITAKINGKWVRCTIVNKIDTTTLYVNTSEGMFVVKEWYYGQGNNHIQGAQTPQ